MVRNWQVSSYIVRFYDTEPRWPVRHEIEAGAPGKVGKVGVFSSLKRPEKHSNPYGIHV